MHSNWIKIMPKTILTKDPELLIDTKCIQLYIANFDIFLLFTFWIRGLGGWCLAGVGVNSKLSELTALDSTLIDSWWNSSVDSMLFMESSLSFPSRTWIRRWPVNHKRLTHYNQRNLKRNHPGFEHILTRNQHWSMRSPGHLL